MLALALGRTIGELQQTLSPDEYAAWLVFFRLYPFDDFHRFHRPAALMSASMSGELDEKLQWLQPSRATPADTDLSVFRALGG